MSGCSLSWLPDAFSWVDPPGTAPAAPLALAHPLALSASNLATNVDVGAAPLYTGAQLWFSSGTVGDPLIFRAGKLYEITTAWWVEVTNNNTVWWLDVFVNGAASELGPGGVGPGGQPLGLGGSQIGPTSLLFVDLRLAPFDLPVYLDVMCARNGGTGTVTFKRGALKIVELVDP